jgi:nitrite reductase/ring-hydroxylating ferredoxin subunit
LNEKFVRAIKAGDVAPGGMKSVELDGNEIVVCNCGGMYHAVGRRCGHQNAPLEPGTLDGAYLTCPRHYAQFDVTTGEALSGPVPAGYGREIPPPATDGSPQAIGKPKEPVRTESIRSYETRIEDGWILVAMESTRPTT